MDWSVAYYLMETSYSEEISQVIIVVDTYYYQVAYQTFEESTFVNQIFEMNRELVNDNLKDDSY